MRKLLLASAALLLLPMATAKADIILSGATPAASFVDLGGVGFGNAPRLITMQTNGIETGSVTPINQPQGDAVPNSGGNKSNTPTLGALGWNSGAQVGLGIDWDQTGQNGATLLSLALTIYSSNAAHTPLGTFSTAGTIQFSPADLALETGNGNSVFQFVLNSAEQAQFNSILAMSGSSGFFAGVSMSAGCGPSPCFASDDGPDSVLGFQAVPGPIVGAGLPGIVMACLGMVGLARRRISRLRGVVHF